MHPQLHRQLDFPCRSAVALGIQSIQEESRGGASQLSRIVVDEITIVGSRCGRFAPALDLLETGAVNVEDLISDEMPLSKGVEAMDEAARKGNLTVLLEPAA